MMVELQYENCNKKKEFGNSDTLSSFHYLFARNSFAKGDKKK